MAMIKMEIMLIIRLLASRQVQMAFSLIRNFVLKYILMGAHGRYSKAGLIKIIY
jgi:hypothetical protein